MSSNFGQNVKISIFGQSHSEAIGVVIDGLPPAEEIDSDEIMAFMARRAPGKNNLSTSRKEADTPEILSGLKNGKTCGAPLCAVIRNSNVRSSDYDNLIDVPRPSHADYPAFIKYKGANDVAGGGHFSGRLTAPLCFAGSCAKQILKRKGIEVGSHIYKIAGISDDAFCMTNISEKLLDEVAKKDFPVINDEKGEEMKKEILKAKDELDSVGGIVECSIIGLPAGIGDPMFDGIENKISQIVFGIPAVRGIEFGAGFKAAEMRGSEHNDSYYYDDGIIKTRTNNAGGVIGGISTGMPIVFKVAFKPTPSIAKKQDSVSLENKTNSVLEIYGRHDPCIVHRAAVCVEAAAAIAVLDMICNI